MTPKLSPSERLSNFLVRRLCFHCANQVMVPFPDLYKDPEEILCEYCE